MRSIIYNKKAVSSILAYLFSFTIVSMVMVSSVIITMNIVNDKTVDVASLEAQSLANKVADALVEAIESKQSMPEASYQQTLDVPMDLAGKSYYIETTSTKVYVNTTDGAVSKSSTTYSAEGLNIGISGRVYGGSSKLDLISNKSDFAYKLDFGTGNSTDHSPVESGYCMVSDRSSATQSLREPPWWNPDYHYRIPIKVENDASEELDEVPVKMVLDTTNFDYSNANVNVTSSSTVSSDLVFIDSEYGIVAEVEISPDTWYTWWLRDYLVGDIKIEVTITELSEGYDLDNIDGDSIKLNGVSCESWDGDEHKATFDPQEALLSLGGSGGYMTPITPGEYTITISGLLNDWTPFYGGDVVTVALADILVDDDADPSWYDATHVQTIQEGIDNAGSGDSVFVYVGTYDENIVIDKTVNLFGEAKTGTIVDGGGSGDVVTVDPGNNNVYIDSFTVRDGGEDGIFINGGAVGETITGITIRNCIAHGHGYNGIYFKRVKDSTIINCETYNNGIGTAKDGIRFWGSDYNTIINCNSHDNSEPFHDLEYSDGIDLKGNSDHNVVENCTLYGNWDDGFDNDIGSSYNIVRNCSSYGNRNGMRIDDDFGYNTIENCDIFSNNEQGIIVFESSGNTITNCDIYDNNDNGILIYTVDRAADWNTIRYTNCYDNQIGITLYGGVLWATDYNTIEYSNCYDNTDYGIWLYRSGELSGEQNWIRNSNCYNTVGSDKQDVGILLEESFSNEIEYCNFYNNKEEGALLDVSRSNLITRCNMFDNGDDGIRLESISSTNAIGFCNFYDNGDDGLHLEGGSKNCIIEYNNFYCNQWAGIYISSATKPNWIQYNNFAEKGVYNAYDQCTGAVRNGWDLNYYDDFNSNPGYPVDYEIPGIAAIPTKDINPNEGPNNDGPENGRYNNPDVIIVEGTGSLILPPPHYHVQTIQEGVTNVIAGGTVYIKQAHDFRGDPATYSGDITISKKLNLIGEDRETVIIDGGGAGNVIKVDVGANKVVLISSLTIRNGNIGINIYHGTPGSNDIEIRDCKIYNNDESGIYVNWPGVKIIDCEIFGSTDTNGNGIYFDSSGDNSIITNCDIHGNNNNGIYISHNADEITITNCDSYENDNNGIFLYLSDKTIITGCSFYDNDYDDTNGGNGIELKQAGSSEPNKNSIINCDMYNNNGNQKHGIHLDDSSNYNEITNCDIYGNKKDGVLISASTSNEITKCNIRDNLEHGIQIKTSSDSNEITNCIVEGNTNEGIRITSTSDSNEIKYCDIYSNDDGINITESSTQNEIRKCNIYSNTQHGISISDSDNNRIVDRNNIRDNDYGIYISGSSNNNEIHHNNFENNNYSAYDAGSNTWDNGYISTLLGGGNHWDNYDESYEGAYDLYSGPNQNILGSDGIVDTPYDIPGGSNKDEYPFGGGRNEVRPYYIDYWNPYGQSIILVNMSLKSNAFKYIYLYYGYDEPLGDFHNHSIEEVSLFSDDFNNDLNKWWTGDATATIEDNSYVNITNAPSVIALWPPSFSIPEPDDPPQILYSKTVNESMYIVEAKMKILEGQGNMYFLQSGPSIGQQWDESYMTVVNVTPLVPSFLLYKDTKLIDERYIKMDDNLVPDLDHWIRIKSYIHLSKTCYKPDASTTYLENMTYINAYLYNYDTFADEGNVSGFENDADGILGDWGPYMSGYIGLGAGLMPSSGESTVWVDWVRVMKTPIVPPTVSIGSMESSTSNYGWTGTPPDSENRETFDPFNPGPVLCDFNNGTTPATFLVNLPEDTYTITVTMGDKDAAHGPMYIKRGSATLLTIPETELGEFETGWFTIKDWPGGNLNLVFSGTDWAVNSMLIERGYKGIKIE